MILVVCNDIQEAYAFGIHELGVQSSLIETMDRLDEIPGHVREVFVHYLPSSIMRADQHHLADVLREAERDGILVHHESHDSWVWERSQLQPKAEPVPDATTARMDKLERDIYQAFIDNLSGRVARLQRACARYRAELNELDGAYEEPDEDPTRQIVAAARGSAEAWYAGDDETLDEERAKAAALEQLAEQQEILSPEQRHDDLKARARELGIRVTSQKPDRLAEQIAEVEAARAKADLSEAPF